MKKIGFVCMALLCFVSVHVNAQGSKNFEGIISYDISFPGLDPSLQLDERVKAYFPQEMKFYIKDGFQRLEMAQAGAGFTSVTINDSKNKSSTILMSMMDKKYAINISAEDLEAEMDKVEMPEIKYYDETKNLAGYKCKKAELAGKDGSKSVIWYTEEINTDYAMDWNHNMPKLKGFPLEFEMIQNNTTMKLTAKSVSIEKMAADLFEIPEGYESITKDQLFGNQLGAPGTPPPGQQNNSRP